MLPAPTGSGDLPEGVHQASLQEVLDRFGLATMRRRVLASRLVRMYELAISTGHLARFIVFGSFVSAKPEPNDVDVFLLMQDSFAADDLRGEAALLFDHAVANAHFGASVFWMRRLAMLTDEETLIRGWQRKRGGGRRGIVEIKEEDS
jgi:hypothetical protein